jgi:AraC-like DNA-binding protein
MTFLVHQVAPPLRPFINFFYAAQGAMPYARDGIFPTASTDLKFNFGDPWEVYDSPGAAPVATCTESWCIGIWNRRHFVDWPARTDFVGVSFKPGGAYAFVGEAQSEFHNRVAPLDAVWARAAREIRHRLYEAGTLERRFALLEGFLIARLAEPPDAAGIVGHVARRIVGVHGGVKIGTLCDEVGISHKHLISLFNRMVGCPPKELARLCRFHHTLQSIDVSVPISWTALAHEHGYFDQSHFNRDFRAYAGLSPADYLRQRRSVHAQRPDHATVSWVLPAG